MITILMFLFAFGPFIVLASFTVKELVLVNRLHHEAKYYRTYLGDTK